MKPMFSAVYLDCVWIQIDWPKTISYPNIRPGQKTYNIKPYLFQFSVTKTAY